MTLPSTPTTQASPPPPSAPSAAEGDDFDALMGQLEGVMGRIRQVEVLEQVAAEQTTALLTGLGASAEGVHTNSEGLRVVYRRFLAEVVEVNNLQHSKRKADRHRGHVQAAKLMAQLNHVSRVEIKKKE